MKRIDNILSTDASKLQDQLFKSIIKDKNDAEFRQKWIQVLYDKHGISKKPASKIKSIFGIHMIRMIAAAVIGIGLFAIATIYLTNINKAEHLAEAYIYEQVYIHPGSVKGVEDATINRILAIKAFNNQDYKTAAQYFSAIDTPTQQDAYYNGLSFLLNKEYAEALTQFAVVQEQGDRYQQEINWYMALTLLLDGQNTAAVKALQKIKEGEWNYTEAQKLLKSI